jgi:hypothetical protein
MIELSKDEKNYIIELSGVYRELHAKIGEIEKMMEDFSKQAQDLCVDLEAKREEEMKFLENLRQKYGAGKIDIFSLSWKKEDENEHQGTN